MENTEKQNQEVLDEIDIAILRELQKNGKLTSKELAYKVNLSTSPVFERQKRLEKLGYIKKYVALVDEKKIGYGLIVLCNIRLKQHSKTYGKEFVSAIEKLPMITDCWNTSGDYDFMMKVFVKDMDDYQNFVLNILGEIDCIGSLHSIFVIGQVKSTTQIPL